MKICILCAVIVMLLTMNARADEQSNQNILSKEATSSYGKNTEDDQPDHHHVNQGHIKIEDRSLERPIKFEDDQKNHGYIDTNKDDPESLLSFDDGEGFDQSNHISNSESRYKGESKNWNNKIKFEGNSDDQENTIYQEGNDDYNQASSSHIVFKDDDKPYKDGVDYSDESEIEAGTANKPIKFENQYNESNIDNRDSYRHPVSEPVVFKDDNQNLQLAQNKKRKPRRKPRYQKQINPAQRPPNSPNPGSGYSGYPGAGSPRPGYPGKGDPNTGYSGYPAPVYPYPIYPSPYPNVAFPTPGYPGLSSYPSIYAPMSSGYGVYATPGHQVQEDQRLPGSHTAYQTQGGLSGHTPQSDQAGLPYQYYLSYPVTGYQPPYPSDASSQYPSQNPVSAQYRPPVYPGVYQQGYQFQGPQRPSRQPKSLTQVAVSAVAEALTSIALYDDQQCVPRILCEVAGGSSTSSPTLLKASASLQPLLSLLQAYNGVSSSPLFIFGRAAVMGLTAKGNPSGCYRAYPKCPRDPEKLINYLNNHNGGFFRFFGQPEAPQQPHNLEQFYNYLSGQNGLPQQPPQQGYGYPSPYGYGFPVQNPYAHSYNYGYNYYNEQNVYRNANDTDSEAESRIQNKPVDNVIEADSDLSSNDGQDKDYKWSFPEDGSIKKGYGDRVKITKQLKRPQYIPSRGSETLKFPDNRSDDRLEVQIIRDYYPRKEKHIFFPGQSHYAINTNYYQTTTPVNLEKYYFDYKHNFYVERPKAVKTDDVVYVVRGNGDPNHPEIVKVKPGQSI